MQTSSDLTSGLASLIPWLNCKSDSLETRFAEWTCASGYSTAGLVWPMTDSLKLVRIADDRGQVSGLGPVPTEAAEISKTLIDGPLTIVWPLPQLPGRLYTLLTPPGQASGLLFVERKSGAWNEVDRNFLQLSAQLIARSPALASQSDTQIPSQGLADRLKDAALVSGRLAHEYAGILTGVCGNSELAAQTLPPGSRAAELLANVARIGQRGTELTRQVHQLSTCAEVRPTPSAVVPVALAAAHYLGLTTSHWPKPPADLPQVALDSSVLGLVFHHLFANALEALPAESPVECSVAVIELSAHDAQGYLGMAHPGTAIEVLIRDYGPGVRSDLRPRLFAEPFVTTKPRHHGLGLAMVFRALAAHHGGVRLEPANPGTLARFVVPIVRSNVSSSSFSPVRLHPLLAQG